MATATARVPVGGGGCGGGGRGGSACLDASLTSRGASASTPWPAFRGRGRRRTTPTRRRPPSPSTSPAVRAKECRSPRLDRANIKTTKRADSGTCRTASALGSSRLDGNPKQAPAARRPAPHARKQSSGLELVPPSKAGEPPSAGWPSLQRTEATKPGAVRRVGHRKDALLVRSLGLAAAGRSRGVVSAGTDGVLVANAGALRRGLLAPRRRPRDDHPAPGRARA